MIRSLEFSCYSVEPAQSLSVKPAGPSVLSIPKALRLCQFTGLVPENHLAFDRLVLVFQLFDVSFAVCDLPYQFVCMMPIVDVQYSEGNKKKRKGCY